LSDPFLCPCLVILVFFLQADVQEDRAAFARMPFAEGVSEVLAALSKEWLTEEEILAPVEQPEEWTPEVRECAGFDVQLRMSQCHGSALGE
jgi:hypothetical protein